MSEEKRDTFISKLLSRILRHSAVGDNIALDSEGYAKVDDILKHGRIRTHKATLDDIKRVVQNNAKQRFTLEQRENGTYYICANQGHTINTVTDQGLEVLSPETFNSQEIFHKTTFKTLEAIFATGGLSRMQRNHIHFKEAGNESVAGVKQNANTIIYVDVQKAMEDGIEFMRSKNDVILSRGVGDSGILPTKYFTRIVNVKNNKEIPFDSNGTIGRTT